MDLSRLESWIRPSERVFRQIESETGIGVRTLRSRCRDRRVVAARNAAIYRLHADYGWDAPRIGQVLGYDRTTVMHSIGRHALENGLPAPEGCINRAKRRVGNAN
jgi:chromosomal replication initiation ATPase DnaA